MGEGRAFSFEFLIKIDFIIRHVPYAEIGASFNNSRFGLLLWGGCFVCCFELGRI